MTESPLYVAIATANREALLSHTLTSLSACQKPSSYRATIVVENGRKGDAKTVGNQFAKELSTRYLHMGERNKSNPLNHALQALDEGLIFFTDDDVRVDHRTLCAYAEAVGDRAGGCYYGCPIGVDYEEPPPGWLLDYLPPSAKGHTWSEQDLRAARFCWFVGSNWAAFASDLRRVGGFDPDFGPGWSTGSPGQETEMQRRLWESGVRQQYVPEAKVWHYVPKERCSPRWALRRADQHGLERCLKGEPQVLNFLGWPRWMVRQWLRKAVDAAKATLSGDRQERFAAHYAFCNYTGFIRGVRWNSTASTEPN